MKIGKIIFTVAIILFFIVSLTSSKITKKKTHSKIKKNTPKGRDLRNHFGTPNIANQYGPQDDQVAQFVQANPDTFAPMLGAKNRARLQHANDFVKYPGYENKLIPGKVKAGEYTNIAPSATHEVNPEITGPKLEVNGLYEYPTAVKVPTFYGFAKEFHPVIAYDKLTGEIIEDSVVAKRPIYNYENRVSNVGRHFKQFYDMRNGEKITVNPKIQNHGINQVSEDWTPPPKINKCNKHYLRHEGVTRK